MIFVSHCAADIRDSRRLAFELLRTGGSFWIDEDQLNPGVRVHDEIRFGMASSAAVVFVTSQHSLQSRFVAEELSLAQEMHKTTVTVLADETSLDQVPASLKDSKIYHARGPSDYARIAHDLAPLATQESGGPRIPRLWVRDIGVDLTAIDSLDLSGPLNVMPAVRRGSVRLFDEQFHDLQLRAFANVDSDVTWLTESSLREASSQRQRGLPRVVSSAISYIEGLLRLDDSLRPGEFRTSYLRSMLLVLVKSIEAELEMVEYFVAPSEEAATRLQQRRGEWTSAAPFEGGLRVDVTVRGELVGSAMAPSYVEPIDLALGMLPGDAVMLAHDLGKVAGWAAGRQAWVSLKSGRALEPFLPSPEQVGVGRH